MVAEHLGGRRPQGRRGFERVAHARRGQQRVAGPVDQGARGQHVERGVEGATEGLVVPIAGNGTAEQGRERLTAGGAGPQGQRLQHGEREAVEPVERPADGRGTAGARGQTVDVRGDGRHEFGPRRHERPQSLVGTAA
ncbi:hypothetical protein GCM10027612_85380 [Microbispora bryophytorum subsp. camponoti]